MYEYGEIVQMSLAAIRKLNDADIITKDILPQELANILLTNEYGITIVSLNEACQLRGYPNTWYLFT
jgi:hypothetical protein